jgi:hypothetical protein
MSTAALWVYAPDLLDRGKIVAAHPEAVVVSSPAALVEAPAGAVVLIDLARPGVLAVLPRLSQMHTIGFARHTREELLTAAVDAGCDEVLPRSVFFRRWGGGVATA